MKNLFAAACLAAFSMPASAAVLPVNGGWQDDLLTAAGDPTANSPWTVTFTATGTLWVLDCCVVGDTFTVSGDLMGVTSFYVGGALHPTLTPFDEWFSIEHGKLVISGIAPGMYTFSVVGDGVGGVPASLYLAATQVPEPATWAMLIAGFGLVGVASRRRRLGSANA